MATDGIDCVTSRVVDQDDIAWILSRKDRLQLVDDWVAAAVGRLTSRCMSIEPKERGTPLFLRDSRQHDAAIAEEAGDVPHPLQSRSRLDPQFGRQLDRSAPLKCVGDCGDGIPTTGSCLNKE
jgi:hypothetical protein